MKHDESSSKNEGGFSDHELKLFVGKNFYKKANEAPHCENLEKAFGREAFSAMAINARLTLSELENGVSLMNLCGPMSWIVGLAIISETLVNATQCSWFKVAVGTILIIGISTAGWKASNGRANGIADEKRRLAKKMGAECLPGAGSGFEAEMSEAANCLSHEDSKRMMAAFASLTKKMLAGDWEAISTMEELAADLESWADAKNPDRSMRRKWFRESNRGEAYAESEGYSESF